MAMQCLANVRTSISVRTADRNREERHRKEKGDTELRWPGWPGAAVGLAPRSPLSLLLSPRKVRRCVLPVVTTLALAAAAGCGPTRVATSTAEDTTDASLDTVNRLLADSSTLLPDSAAIAVATATLSKRVSRFGPAALELGAPHEGQPLKLSPLADSVAQYLVFDPIVQTWFLGAKRGKRLLLDIGRVDLDVQHDKRRGPAYLQAVKALSPVPIGTPVRIYSEWGVEDDSITGFATWNNRIVATLHLSPHLDSLVRHAPTAYAAVERTDTASVDSASGDTVHPPDSTAPARTPGIEVAGASGRVALDTGRPSRAAGSRDGDTARQRGMLDTAANGAVPAICQHDSLPAALAMRAAVVRDSIDLWLRSLPQPPYDRLVNTERSQSTQVAGCFGDGNRLAVAVDLRAGANEWVRERAVLIDSLGRVTNLHVSDFRFKAHDFLAALDPNGSGTDGIVARGLTEGEGGIAILALEPGNRLTRWVDGFAWEAR
jgi:hypothetical protein